MSEGGVDGGLPPVPPKEPERPESVALRTIEVNNPRDVARYSQIDQSLDPDKWATAKLSRAEVEKELQEHATPVPFVRKDPEPDFYLFGVAEPIQGTEPGKLLGFMTTYRDEYIDRIKASSGDVSTELQGKDTAEVAFAKHADVTVEQMVAGLHLGVDEVVREHTQRTGKTADSLVITSYVRDDPEDTEALQKAGFTKKGTFDLKNEGQTEAEMWDMYTLHQAV